jgi:Na+/H+ antiporter NhaD/arsenite permease-like protein
MQEYLALGIFVGVYALMVARKQLRVPIWTAMLIGAALMIVTQILSIEQAFNAINLEVIGFLFGMFTIVSALDRAGVIQRAAIRMLSLARTPARLLMVVVVGVGGMASFLVNDTIALVGVPLAAYAAARAGIRPVILLLGLAFGITIGSVMTPIGNPQNILIAAQSGIASPFLTFLTYLAIPTVLNLVVTYFILKMFYRRELTGQTIFLSRLEFTEKMDGFSDPRLTRLSIGILVATLGGCVLSEVLTLLNLASFSLGAVAMLGAAAMYALSSHRVEILKGVNYPVLVFFAAMFVVMSAMWSSGAVSMIFGTILPDPNPADLVQSTGVISAASIGMSQVLSNVPFVTVYNFVMTDSGFTGAHVDQWMMLVAASTIAGNLTILGAASNIIVIEAAEARRVPVFSFFEFLKVGSVVTSANIAVYYVFIVFL